MRNLIERLKYLKQVHQAEVMLAVWDEAKAHLAWLVDNHLFVEASDLSDACTRSFAAYTHTDIDVTRSVIRAFPVNSRDTMRFLGIDDDLDQYIINNKLRIEYLTQSEHDGYRDILRWAVARKNLPLIAKVTKQVSSDLTSRYADKPMFWAGACHSMIGQLTQSGAPAVDLGAEIDETIAGLVVSNLEYKGQATEMVDIASFGLRKTLLKMLECGLFWRESSVDLTEDQLSVIMAALPSQPNEQELAWMHNALDTPSLTERILLDPAVDMNAYIQTLRETNFGNLSCALNYLTLQFFKSLLNEKQLNTPLRQRRASLLIDAVFDQQNPERNVIPALIESLKSRQWGFGDYIFKLCRQTKGLMLENDLGM